MLITRGAWRRRHRIKSRKTSAPAIANTIPIMLAASKPYGGGEGDGDDETITVEVVEEPYVVDEVDELNEREPELSPVDLDGEGLGGGEGHVAMILNRVSFLDAITVLSGGSVTNI